MGMYTELFLSINIHETDMDVGTKATLKAIIDGDKDLLPPKWSSLSKNLGAFDGGDIASLKKDHDEYELLLKGSIKNHPEIICDFLRFIAPKANIYPEGFIGYIHYEEWDTPIILTKHDAIRIIDINQASQEINIVKEKSND